MSLFTYYLEAATKKSGFKLPKKAIPGNYKITDSLRDFTRNKDSKWQVKTLVANNGGKIGKFERVGYVAVNLKNNEIIPISVNDEHNQGYEILNNYYKKKGIVNSVNDWRTVSTSNYVYGTTEISEWLVVAKKWIEYGGDPETPIESPGYNGAPKFVSTFKEFLETDGKPPTTHAKTGTIKPAAKELFSILERLARAMVEYHNGRPNQKVFDLALDLYDWNAKLGFRSPMFQLIYPIKHEKWDLFKNYEDTYKEKVMKAMAQDDYAIVEKLVFSFDGWKNLIHMGLKYYDKMQNSNKISSTDEDDIRRVEYVFGDIAASIKELDKIGGI